MHLFALFQLLEKLKGMSLGLRLFPLSTHKWEACTGSAMIVDMNADPRRIRILIDCDRGTALVLEHRIEIGKPCFI